ncbi:uracil-DNA-glycosylase [Bacteroidales bacterium]|nr:uracil-DNA-glycosylase [Bacteroidales bacterium]
MGILVKIENSWKKILQEEFEKDYFKSLSNFVSEEYSKHTIYPPAASIFNAFNLCPFHSIKVLILGQDPYHQPNQAHGLCFSVNEEMPIPASLKNIFKELNADLAIVSPSNGNLERWAKQGVFLLNATLTVRDNEAGSHQNKGWEIFTDAIIKTLAAERENIVFILWGAYAQKKECLIDTSKHLVLKSPHPSPLSSYRGFFGNKHFSKANEYLIRTKQVPINW